MFLNLKLEHTMMVGVRYLLLGCGLANAKLKDVVCIFLVGGGDAARNVSLNSVKALDEVKTCGLQLLVSLGVMMVTDKKFVMWR